MYSSSIACIDGVGYSISLWQHTLFSTIINNSMDMVDGWMDTETVMDFLDND